MFTRIANEAARFATAILSQILRASSTFVIPLVAARTLSAHDFASFNVIIAIFGAALVAFSSFGSDPTLTYRAETRAGGPAGYVRVIDRFSFLAGIGVGLVFLALSVVAHGHDLRVQSQAWFGLALVAPPFFLAHARDRLSFALAKPIVAMASNAVAVGVSLASVLIASLFVTLDVLVLLASVAMGQVLSYLLYLFNMADRTAGEEARRVNLVDILRHHLMFGRWSVVGQFLWWAMTNVFLFVLPWMGEPVAASKFRLLQILNMPATLAAASAALFITPRLAAMARSKAFRYSGFFYALIVLAAPVYVSVMIVAANPLLSLLVGGRLPSLSKVEVVVASLTPVANGLLLFAVAAARGAGRANLQVAGSLIGLMIGSLVGVLLVGQHGLIGALAGQILCFAIGAVCVEVLLRAWGLSKQGPV